jgi:hypothetical protein
LAGGCQQRRRQGRHRAGAQLLRGRHRYARDDGGHPEAHNVVDRRVDRHDVNLRRPRRDNTFEIEADVRVADKRHHTEEHILRVGDSRPKLALKVLTEASDCAEGVDVDPGRHKNR